jgi:carboxyvinyl-carboxyphosphonate phosphorylmutase
MKNSGARRLRELLTAPKPVLAPGVYDVLSARLVEAAGFPAVYMTGFGTAAALLGQPDIGLLGLSEMVDNARRIVQAVQVPVIADADTGYGNPLNVIRTVHEYETAGVAAIHLEDQMMPKRCGHTEGKQVIPCDEMVEKIRAAVAARRSADFVIIARTDARAIEGMEGALQRARCYAEAGADVLFVEAPQNEQEIETVAATLSGFPLLFNWLEGGKTPSLSLPRLQTLGFRIVIFPLCTLLAATRAIAAALEQVRTAGTPLPVMPQLMGFADFLAFIGMPEMRELERQFGKQALEASGY